MSLSVLIKMQKGDEPYYERFNYDGDLNITVSSLLERLNSQYPILNADGKEVDAIKWSCSCLQGLCGSCAMVINGFPQLACKCFVNEEIATKARGEIRIEPLSKFPVIEDLKIDRTKIYESLKNSKQWINSSAKINGDEIPFEYEMSQCLLCGCCLEACPNYDGEDDFMGAALAVSSAKLALQEKDKKHKEEMKIEYEKHFYSGCVKSLVCDDICPMKIDTQRAISKMNKKLVWNIWDYIK